MKAAQKKFFAPKGFTLIELLVVITIIATLAVTVFVALNPSQRLKDSKDARRTSDVDTILTAIHASIVDNGGNTPTALVAGTVYQLGTGIGDACMVTGNSSTNCTVATGNCADLLDTGDAYNLTKYLKAMPIDPNTDTYSAATTGYTAVIDTNGIVTITACGTEGSTTPLSASR